MVSDLDSRTDIFATEGSSEVDNLSPPEVPNTMGDSGEYMIGECDAAHGGPEPR